MIHESCGTIEAPYYKFLNMIYLIDADGAISEPEPIKM